MVNFDKKIKELLVEAFKNDIFSTCSAGIYFNNGNKHEKILINSGYCQNYPRKINSNLNTIFDLASLSKSMSTVLCLVSLINYVKFTLKDKISKYFPDITPKDKEEITVYQLLNHSSGLPAHRPYFRRLSQLPIETRRDEVLRLIMAEPLESRPGEKTNYSDLGFILLGCLVEIISNTSLDRCFQRRVAMPPGLSSGIFYNRLPARRRGSYAATDYCPWRKRMLRGEVSDENCAALGGVSGHAGLFGRLEEVLGLTSVVLDIWQGRATHPQIGREELRIFLEDVSPVPESTWALGFDRPSRAGSSSGKYFSPTSVGHLGFTGTSFWIDPERDLVVVLLTNRVHPSRDNEKIRKFRPYFHDRIIELLDLV